jgi:CheY-like chemotaxis protein
VALKILLADDSMTAQNMGKKILVDAGYEVIAVSNGAAAIKKVASERPDIAILDVYMPGYTGLEVCERVRASSETGKTPVLLTVGKMEPFNPEEVGRVKADGVMIKPFEATDLIAAVQSIAQRLLAPAPPPRGIDHTVQLRTSPGQTIEDTLKMTKPPAHPGHEDTMRIPAPKPDAASHEETIRLTAQEIKAFQDASYHDWKANAEPHLEEDERAELAKAAAAEEAVVTPEAEEPEPSEPAMAESAAMLLEPQAESAPAFYVPPSEEPAVAAFAVQEELVPEAAVGPVTPSYAPQPAMSHMTAALEAIVDAMSAPAMSEALEGPALETNAPLMPGPMPVAPAAELEPTSIPAMEVATAPEHGLEITSPVHEPGYVVAQDPALITDTDDMSQFVTKFGVENAEPVHVGMASDLPEEQLAAINSVSPMEEPASTEPPSGMTSLEPEIAASAVEVQVGALHAVTPIESVEPLVAYVPEVEDSQSFPVARDPEAELAPPAVQAPMTEAEPVEPVEPVRSVTVRPQPASEEHESVVHVSAMPDFSTHEEHSYVPPRAEVAPETAAEFQPVSAIAEAPTVAVSEAEVTPEHVAVVHAVETALAAAAGTAVAGIALPALAPVPDAFPAASEPHEPYGDAALAEELAAAIANKAVEEHTQTTTTGEYAEAAGDPASLSARGTGATSISDSKLADAVARAFENLKPQLITEIIKHLAR